MIGINGSGKTSVLNVIAWMLTPSLVKLAQTDFRKIEVGCSDDGGEQRVVSAKKQKGQVLIGISGVDRQLEVPIFEYPSESPLSERSGPSIPEMYERFRVEHKSHPVLAKLEQLGPPLYLPLDRRWEAGDRENRPRTRPWMRYRPYSRTGSVIESVLYLAERYYRERQSEVGELSEKLRNSLVEYAFGDVVSMRRIPHARKPWSPEEIRKRKETILAGLDQAKIQVPEEVVRKYFSSLETIAKRTERKGFDPKNPSVEFFDWAINMPQVEKIERVIAGMEGFNRQREDALRRVTDFISTLNSFLCDTRKVISFDSSGEIVVQLGEGKDIRPENLSSGEAQLVILFTSLYFGFDLTKKFLVMIDEPELSLHLDWQHRYVESVVKANPNAQFVFATHAPEIGQGHDEQCIELSPVGARQC